MLLSAGQSLMVMKSNARRLKCSSACTSHTRTPSSFHSKRRSSTSSFRYTSKSLPGYLGPRISTSIIMNFHFIHSPGGRLYIQSVTGQVLWPLLCSPKGLMPSILKPNLMFLASSAKAGNVMSTFLHWAHNWGVSTYYLASSFLYAIASTLYWFYL
jgi:hypothetical protein